jgi:hypothetical protein
MLRTKALHLPWDIFSNRSLTSKSVVHFPIYALWGNEACVCGLERSIDLLTSLPERDGKNVVVQGGYPHFNKYHQILQNKDCLNTLAYYDVVNFARKVTAPTYLTWGYNDVTCPPTTSYAVWNTLKCKKKALLTPINEHWTTSETNYRQMVWIKEHLVK